MVKILICLVISVAWVQAKQFEFVAPPQELVPGLLQIGQTCVAESGADADIFQKLIKGSYSTDDNTKKFLYCYMTKGNYADSNGYFVEENILPVFGSHEKVQKISKVVDQCNTQAREANYEDKYEKAYALMNCFHQNTPLKLKVDA